MFVMLRQKEKELVKCVLKNQEEILIALKKIVNILQDRNRYVDNNLDKIFNQLSEKIDLKPKKIEGK